MTAGDPSSTGCYRCLRGLVLTFYHPILPTHRAQETPASFLLTEQFIEYLTWQACGPLARASVSLAATAALQPLSWKGHPKQNTGHSSEHEPEHSSRLNST